jgi:hypothetical protein
MLRRLYIERKVANELAETQQQQQQQQQQDDTPAAAHNDGSSNSSSSSESGVEPIDRISTAGISNCCVSTTATTALSSLQYENHAATS